MVPIAASVADWELEAATIAYGELGLKPWEFERLTPREFELMVEGYEQRRRIALSDIAQLSSWILLPHVPKGKKAPTVRQFMGEWLWRKLWRLE